jgi:hypothetical protein
VMPEQEVTINRHGLPAYPKFLARRTLFEKPLLFRRLKR